MDAFLENSEASIQQKSALGRFFITNQSLRHRQWLLSYLSSTVRTERYWLILATDAPTIHVLRIEWLKNHLKAKINQTSPRASRKMQPLPRVDWACR